MNRVFGVAIVVLVAFGMSLLIIPALGIVAGLTKKHVIEPAYQRYIVPPTYVDDPRCCR